LLILFDSQWITFMKRIPVDSSLSCAVSFIRFDCAFFFFFFNDLFHFQLGWVTGTGGGISMKQDQDIYIAPSGVQKERIQPEDMFVYTLDGKEKNCPPPAKGFKASQCTPLFFAAFNKCGAGAVIHTHSQHAVRVTLLAENKEFRITHQEMIKGIRQGTNGERLRYFDTLVVPIIDNTTHESDLTEALEAAIDSELFRDVLLFGVLFCF